MLRATFVVMAASMLALWGWSLVPPIENWNNPNEDGFFYVPAFYATIVCLPTGLFLLAGAICWARSPPRACPLGASCQRRDVVYRGSILDIPVHRGFDAGPGIELNAVRSTVPPLAMNLAFTSSRLSAPNVRYRSKADIRARPHHVRFTPESGHGTRTCTKLTSPQRPKFFHLLSAAQYVDFCVGNDEALRKNGGQIACDTFADMRMLPTKLIERFNW